MNLAALRRNRLLWQEQVQRLTIAELKGLSLDGNAHAEPSALYAARWAHHQMHVRIAHRLRDFLFLPYKVMANPSMKSVFDKYVAAFQAHEEFHGAMGSEEAVGRYWLALAKIFEDNARVTRLLGAGRRQLVQLDPALAGTLDAFLDRFYTSRIGTHLVGSSFLQTWPVPDGARKPASVAMGILQLTSPERFIRDLANSPAAPRFGEAAVPIDIEDSIGPPVLYVPGHLRTILREILYNAMEATAQAAQNGPGSSEPVPVRVRVNRGQFGVFVTISDQGGGIRCMERTWSWGARSDPLPTAAAADGESLDDLLGAVDDDAADWPADTGEHQGQRPLPLGFGAPLARLTARYFGGDLKLQTLLGYGTSAYVHIPELQQEGEVGADDSRGFFF